MKKYLFAFTLSFFALGMVNIHFALLGLVCMALPLILLFKNRKKTWCQSMCPRASLYTACAKATKRQGLKTPRFFIKGEMRWIMLTYFAASLFFIALSTVRVARGAMPPMNFVRFLLVFNLPFDLPQLFTLSGVLPWVTHFSYRFYSMMLTTTALGLLLALIFKPRTWCTVCPIATVSDLYIKNAKNGAAKKAG